MIDPVPFVTYTLVMSITPGPNNVMLTASGANFGFRRTLPHIFGIVFGFIVQLLAVCAGLSALFIRWPRLQSALAWVGAAYLLYLGWQMLGHGEAESREAHHPVTFVQAALFQFLNPKAWVMTVTAATLFLPRELADRGQPRARCQLAVPHELHDALADLVDEGHLGIAGELEHRRPLTSPS